MRRTVRLLSAALIAACVVCFVPSMSAASADDLKVGDAAPGFTLPGTDGKIYSLAQLKGKTVVLAWFPKAFTGG